ncbi:protein of unknown function [Paraburkholderia dioscoreae]|uniref:Uncharacterized protein n=1 Tax=Paraburkholderia dioscoreae TaxID=2604047 RepID=A0A5Q4Z669_9BURK|nr:protein of unknown function [Paraburkholderia dioscoreae]
MSGLYPRVYRGAVEFPITLQVAMHARALVADAQGLLCDAATRALDSDTTTVIPVCQISHPPSGPS